MKIEILKLSLAALIGALLYAYFQPKPSSNQPEVSQLQMQDCQVIVKKTVNPDGSVDEVTQFLASQRQKQEVKPVKIKKYLAGLKREYDFKNQVDAYELSLGRKVTDDLSVVFSYNTKQVAGVGLVLEF